MTASRPKLDIDTTRDGLLTLGCIHAAEQLEQMLAEAVRTEVPAHSFLYARGAIMITTNKSVRDRTELLAGDEVLTTAILDPCCIARMCSTSRAAATGCAASRTR